MFKDKKIDKSISVPYYYQLKLLLEEYIENEHPNLDDPIPTEEQISAIFELSRPTIRQAINELVAEGKLFRAKGKGTYVKAPILDQCFTMQIDSFENEMRKNGYEPYTDILKFERIFADKTISAALQIPYGSEVTELWRLRYVNKLPFVLCKTFLPYDKCPGFTAEEFKENSLYDMLENKYNYKICTITRSMEAKFASEYTAKKLEIFKDAPIQYFESIAYLEDDTPIEFSKAEYRGDMSRFHFRLSRNNNNEVKV